MTVPFRLLVPTLDESEDGEVSWTTFRVHGLIALDQGMLAIEWAGTAHSDAVTGLTVKSENTAIPPGCLRLPRQAVRSLELRGWLRPRIEVTGAEMRTLDPLPADRRGVVSFRVARRDLGPARHLVAHFHSE